MPGKTLYRTGDLVYRDAAGGYFFSGRKTELVAHNGTRVSLTEVALALRTAEGVTAAFCALVDNRGALGIAAFVQAAPGVTAAADTEAARLQLPPAMLPDEIIVVETFPLTLSGKVDREKLLAGAELAPWQAAGPEAAVG